MQLLDLYVLILRLVGILVALTGIGYLLYLLTAFASVANGGFLLSGAIGLVVHAAAAFVLLSHPQTVAQWLCGEEGKKTLTFGIGPNELQSVLLFAIGFYLVVTAIPSLMASVIPQPHYKSGILWQGILRPALQIVVGALILTRKRWIPVWVRALNAWKESRGD